MKRMNKREWRDDEVVDDEGNEWMNKRKELKGKIVNEMYRRDEDVNDDNDECKIIRKRRWLVMMKW